MADETPDHSVQFANTNVILSLKER